MSVPALLSKPEMYAAYERGLFGNRALTWPTKDAMLADGYSGIIGLRCRDPRGGGARFRTGMTLEEADAEYATWTEAGVMPELIVWCEGVPVDRILFQGEIGRSVLFFDLTYTTEKGVPNRPNMWKHPQHASGLQALHLCKHFMNPKSYANLLELFDTWPDAIVEFSVLDYDAGSIPGHNTIFWEVRHY